MRLDILIVSYNRPDYLTVLLTSLRDQHLGGYELGEIHLMQDGPNPQRMDDDKEKIAQCIDVFQSMYPSGCVHAAPVNIGINGNYTTVVHYMAASQADAVIVFEDDLHLSPHYLNVMVRLVAYAETSTQVGMVSAKGLLGASMAYQQQRKRALLPMASVWGIHRWGWGMTRDTITEFAPILEMYLDYATRLGFSDNGNTETRAQKFSNLQQFINAMGFYQTVDGIEIDTMYDVAAYILGRVHLCTYANFITPIGELGIHYDAGTFRGLNLHNAVQFDTPPEDFEWYEPDIMNHIQTLIRRFHTSVRLNYNSGKFGCQIPFDGLQNADLLRAHYEDVFGWPLTTHDLSAHKLPHIATNKSQWPGPATGLLKTALPIERHYSFPYAI